VISQAYPLTLANLETPDMGWSVAALLLGATAVLVVGLMLSQIWVANQASHPVPKSAFINPRRARALSAKPQLPERVGLLSLTVELKANLARCQKPTLDPLAIKEFQSLCDELVCLPYDTMKNIWTAYMEMTKINHYVYQATQSTHGKDGGAARTQCIHAKRGCCEKLISAIHAIHALKDEAEPAPATEAPERVLPPPARTAGSVMRAIQLPPAPPASVHPSH